MRCIQYATGEYLIYDEAVAIALSGYRHTDHVGVDRAEDRPLSEDEVLESLLNIDGVQVEEHPTLDSEQKQILEDISLHHPTFRHKVEALGVLYFLVESANKRQRKKDAKKRAQRDAKEIPPTDRFKDTKSPPRELVPPTKPKELVSPTGPKPLDKSKQPGVFEKFMDSLSENKSEKVDKVYRRIFGDDYKYKDMHLSEKQLDQLKKGLTQEGLSPDDVKKQFDVMNQDVRWAHFLDLPDDEYTLPRVSAKPSWDAKWDGKKWGEIRKLLHEALCEEAKVEPDELRIGETKLGDEKVTNETILTSKDIDNLTMEVVLDTNSTFQKVSENPRFEESHGGGEKKSKTRWFIIKDRLSDYWDEQWGDSIDPDNLPTELSLKIQDLYKKEAGKKLDSNKFDVTLDPMSADPITRKDSAKYYFVAECRDKETAEKIAKALGLSVQEIKEE